MAQSISDVFARAKSNSNDGGRRTARFVGGAPAEVNLKPEAGDTSQIATSRRAAYRPAETLALRRDVVHAFSAAMLRDFRLHGDEQPRRFIDAARAYEVLGEFEEAYGYLRDFEQRGGQWNWDSASIERRILRGVEGQELLRRALRQAPELADAPNWGRVYAGLEEAYFAWNSGDEPHLIRRRCQKAVRGLSQQPCIDPFAAVWAMQLGCDAALESGDTEAAFESLKRAINMPELNVDLRQELEARRAVWMHVYGRHHEAQQRLDELAKRGALPGDLDDLLVSLCFESGDRSRAFAVLRSIAGDRCRLREHAIPLVMLHETQGGNAATGRDVLKEATTDRDDWTLLRLHETFLEAAGADGARARGADLIDVLNRRLEGPLSVEERVNTLTRLGRLYEVEAELEEAAAEVYREALHYDSRHVPALRALGRLYTRRENWKALAELYEREIATVGSGSGGWRRHFQLAELYEHRLQRDERALENYLVVLEERPNYLPALKSSARILGRLGRWTRLADLFLRMVDSAPSRRQKSYLLDKVAEVAEDQLENYEVAIGAWKEILDLTPGSPRAYTALGRLYAKTHRWQDLIDLNTAEIELIDDPEEIASIWLRNAEIAEQRLEDIETAERYYRRTLEVIPDYLPALEALGRIYQRGGRWADIVEMTGRELKLVSDPRKATRQLGALAEIFETRLERRDDAIAIYEELWSINPGDGHVFAALSRLYRAEGHWSALEELLNARLQHNPGSEEFAALQGELAMLAEWRTDRPERAYRRYLSALQCAPTNLHWLVGVARTWPDADVTASEVADELEDRLMHVTGEEIRDRYFMILARLRERSEGSPEASRAFRAHGSATSLENQIVSRLAMAVAGERQQLLGARKAVPHHPWQQIITFDRLSTDESETALVADAASSLPDAARQWFAGETSPKVAGIFGESCELSSDLVAIVEGAQLHTGDDDELQDRRRLRLRALQARRYGDQSSYVQWTVRELEALPQATVAARRLELARYATRHDLPEEDDFYRLACGIVFPELAIDDGLPIDEDEPVEIPEVAPSHIDRLYEALRETDRWGLLRRCLEAQVARPENDRGKRLELFEELGDLLRKKIGDYEGARDALVHCWQLSEKPKFLRRIVTLALEYGEDTDALRFQKKHFEKLSISTNATSPQRVQSGVWLAELLLDSQDLEQRTAAIDCLEHLAESYDDVEGMRRVRRMLARAHADSGNGRRAVEIFEEVLHFQVRNDELDDWRRLVDVHREQLSDLRGAYSRQWRIVRAFPGSRPDLDTLIDLAAESGETADCIEQLGALASATADENKVRLLARSAEAADEELGHAEEAFRLFERVLKLIDDDHERRVYFERRRAVCLARMAGREPRAMEAFRSLIVKEPFEPANYRGMETLFERANAHDRLRISRQTLRMLGCQTDESSASGKDYPTRSLQQGLVEKNLMPKPLENGVFEVLRAAIPLVRKVFGEALPQKKALNGQRVKSDAEYSFYGDIRAALLAFGVTKFKLYVGECGPDHPLVFSSGTPVVWLNQALLERLSDAESRFVAGYCAALAWSELPALMALDGRQVWHLIEGVLYRHSGAGFSERIDLASQEMSEKVSSPFYLKSRHTLVKAIEACERDLDGCHCEAWGRRLETFAARAGLLLSGDLAAAASAMLRLSGWNLSLEENATQQRLRNQETIEDLVHLAHSDEYLALRYEIGLAGRPSQLGA